MTKNTPTPSAHGWNFDNSYARLPVLFYEQLTPVLVSAPQLVVLNRSLAETLGLNAETLSQPEGVAILAGNRLPTGATPLAQAYAGHQFGGFTMLGDGRAILLGEQIAPDGQRFDIQLKGSGQTPFSRRGDGRAALAPMLREYLISEAMYALGIPTNRSLAVVKTGERVYRETPLPGAILTRVAASHLRVGTFEYIAAQGSREELRTLADYTITRHFPGLEQKPNPYLELLHGVINRQASLVAGWQQVGFIHGVLNTDNVALSGEAIDYGPCAFIDSYHPDTVFSSIDRGGRYAFANQPLVTQWNLARFAETLLPLLATEQQQALDLARSAVDSFTEIFEQYYRKKMRAKLGIFDEEHEDIGLIDDLLAIMQRLQADYTNSFRDLASEPLPENELFSDADFIQWHKHWRARLQRQQRTNHEISTLMNRHNPAIIPRNHRVEAALQAAEQENDLMLFNKLLRLLADPYSELPEKDVAYRDPPPPSKRTYKTFCGT